MLQLVVALSAICGIVGCAAGLEKSKRTDSRIFPFWQAAPSQACWTPFPAWSVTKPFCHHHVAQATALCGSPVKAASEHTSVIALNNSLHLHCYSWRRLTDASFLLANAPRTCSVRSISWETIYGQRLASSIDTGWRQTNVGIPFHSTCAFHLALLDSMICWNWSWPFLPSVV